MLNNHELDSEHCIVSVFNSERPEGNLTYLTSRRRRASSLGLSQFFERNRDIIDITKPTTYYYFDH